MGAELKLAIEPLNAQVFSDYGDVLEVQATPTVMINQGNCARYSDLAAVDFETGRAGVSIFQAKPYAMPISLAMMERHPLGSQAFIPMDSEPFLVIVASDLNNAPHMIKAFVSNGQQGVNYHRNTWHGVLCPISGNGIFAVVDRIGDGDNLQEHWFDHPYLLRL